MNQTERLEKDKIPNLFFRLAIPTIIAQVINFVYNIVDRIYIGRVEDSALAMAALAVSLPVITMVAAFTNLFGIGGAPLAAIKMGQGDKKGAEKILSNSFSVLIITAIFLMVMINLFLDPLLYGFGASDENIHLARGYVGIYSYGTLFVQFTLGLNPYINTQGFTKLGMLTVLIGAVLNIILDPIFIFVFNMGVQGAALATIISQGVSAVWVLLFFFKGKSKLKIRKEYLMPNPKIVLSIVALGVSPFIMGMTESFVQISFNNQLLLFGGTTAVSSMAILISLYQVNMMILQGFSYGAQPIMSYNYGAGRLDRVRATFKLFFGVCLAFSVVTITLTLIFAKPIVSIFSDDSRTIELATWAILPFLSGALIAGIQMACQFSFLSLGQAKRSLAMACFRKLVMLIPLIYILPMLIGESDFAVNAAEPIAHLVEDAGKVFSVFLAESISDAAAAICTGVLFMLFYMKNLRDKPQNLKG